jgi:predicted AAA+ superfamily ATPase
MLVLSPKQCKCLKQYMNERRNFQVPTFGTKSHTTTGDSNLSNYNDYHMSTYDLEPQLDFDSIDLYARQEEIEKLKQAYKRSSSKSISRSTSQIVWLSGYSGTGKSSIVQYAFRGIENYCCGRFDYDRNALPFAELVRMVQELCIVLLLEEELPSNPNEKR